MVESSTRQRVPVRLSAAGELDRVYREQSVRMWRALTAFSGSRDIAEDAVAEAFTQAVARGDGVRSPERWVWKAAYRIAAGDLQRRGRDVPLVVEGPVEEEEEEPAWELRAALMELPPLRRAVLVLHYYCGYRTSEIAAIVGSTPGGVRMSLSRGRRQLRRMLEVTDD